MAGTGGARPGAGRKKGKPNNKTAALQAAIEDTGETPLAYMVRVMRDRSVEHNRRDEMAKAAAPYIHSKLANVQLTGKDGGPIQTEDVGARDKLAHLLNRQVAPDDTTEGTRTTH